MLDAFTPTEMTEQGLQFLGAQPLHALQRVGQAGPAASLPVEGVDEAVRFVPRMNEHPTSAVEHQRVVAVAEDGLLALGEGRQGEAVGPAVLFERLLDGAEVGLAAVDEQQVRPFFLALCPAHDDFFHHAQIVHRFAFDDVFPVLAFGRSTVAHHDAGTDPFIALKLGHVEAHDVVELVHAQGLCSFVGCPLFERAAGFVGHALQLNLGVLAGEGGEVLEVAALGCANFNR